MGSTRWRRGITLSLAVLAVVAASCMPFFESGATLTATALGPLVRLSWTAAVEDDAGEFVDHYGIEVDGVEVDTTSSAATACVLTGLASSTTYTISITAYGSTGEWSGDWTGGAASKARVSTSYTTPSTGNAGATRECMPTTDSDGDRLPDAAETGDGVFHSAAAAGTKPNDTDSDDDRVNDGDEVLGTTGGLDLPALGVNPVHKDILLEADWFADNLDCAAHNHRPTDAMETRLANAFAAAPVANPDGTTGINVVLDRG